MGIKWGERGKGMGRLGEKKRGESGELGKEKREIEE